MLASITSSTFIGALASAGSASVLIARPLIPSQPHVVIAVDHRGLCVDPIPAGHLCDARYDLLRPAGAGHLDAREQPLAVARPLAGLRPLAVFLCDRLCTAIGDDRLLEDVLAVDGCGDRDAGWARWP